jgi:hypothetical protein
MKSLFEESTVAEVMERLDALQPASERQWGKMSPAQALAHCSAAMEMAIGDRRPPRVLIGRLIGPLFKSVYSSEKPFSQNNPTHPSLVVTGQPDFDSERTRLRGLVERFSTGGAPGCTTHPHCFFGSLTPREWGIGMYKHLDHHLRQFGA